MKAALEGDDGGALGRQARNLDGVLDRLGARVEEDRATRAAEGCGRDQPLGNGRVDLVGDDREIGVQEAPGLFANGFDHVRVRMPDRETADPARQVEQPVAVHVGHDRAQGRVDHERCLNGHRRGDGTLLAREDLTRARAR